RIAAAPVLPQRAAEAVPPRPPEPPPVPIELPEPLPAPRAADVFRPEPKVPEPSPAPSPAPPAPTVAVVAKLDGIEGEVYVRNGTTRTRAKAGQSLLTGEGVECEGP